jgi:CheY-like chemotaxis protein/anti-sigma regulatory factor (Ser/Thr protein kinase)
MSAATALVEDKPIELHQEVQPDLPSVWGDESRLQQVILNFLSNAAKFTDAGSITLRAWGDAEQVTVSVVDTGVGIAPEHQAIIFEEFRQVDGSLSRKAGGTGLGLPISRHLVEEHGGRIWVESAPGEGATFSFTVPINPPQQIQLPEELALLEIDPSRQLILAVDGQEGVVAVYQRYLEKHGYQVIGLQEGTKALEWARALQPFAIIQDLSLPDKDGWAVLEELKSAAETRNIPVIVSTMDRDSHNRALRSGAAAYLVKPVLEKDLLDALKPSESR